MYARIPTFKITPDRIDEAVQQFKEVSLPGLQKLAGFKGANVLVDRKNGMFRVIAFWQDLQALEGSRDAVKPIREGVAQKVGAEIVSVEEWEVALDA
jgi:quinol monooxygenase YgiN